MTDNEKKQIESYRKNGYGYKQISNLTNLSVNTIKSYCKRNKLMSADLQSNDNHTLCCEQCGKPVEQNEHRKRKRFCSDACRNKWWNNHLDLVKRKAIYELTCHYCRKTFTVYGNAKENFAIIVVMSNTDTEENKMDKPTYAERYTLTVKEAGLYFNIGIKKMRKLAKDNLGIFSVLSGNRYLIIRTKFEEYLCNNSTI